MFRRTQILLIAAAVAALLAACGGGGAGSSTTSTSKTTAAARTSQTTSTSSSKTSGGSPSLGSLGAGQIATYCQAALTAAKNLTSSEKSELKAYCSSLAHDNPAQIKAAEKTLCKQLLKGITVADRAFASAECAKL
jgi:hypothetical protein